MQPRLETINDVLRTVRVTGSVQFCMHAGASWHTQRGERLASPHKQLMCFHILVEGSCWIQSELGSCHFSSGDIVAFPFGDGHAVGAGNGEAEVTPLTDLPPGPWQSPPVLTYGSGIAVNRLICGFLHCEALNYPPMRRCLPPIIHIKTRDLEDNHWLRAAVEQLAVEIENPKSGGAAIIERLTEVMVVELLRYQLLKTDSEAVGWLAALSDQNISRCVAAIHAEPGKAWSLTELAKVSGLSRTLLSQRFADLLGLSPMRYLRDWRLFLAGMQLKSTRRSIGEIADDAGYGTEAAFTRAFARSMGMPPAAWRKQHM